jgi:hypothetical protein
MQAKAKWVKKTYEGVRRPAARRRRVYSANGALGALPAALHCETLESRALPTVTAINTLRDGYSNAFSNVYSFDGTGGSINPLVNHPKNGFYIDGILAGSLSASLTVNRVLTGDFDGDFDKDVAAQVGNNWHVGIRNGASFIFGTTAWGTLGGTGYTDFLVGDFITLPNETFSTGRKEDIAVRDANGQWIIAASTGTGFSNVSTGVVWMRAPADDWKFIQKGDFNSDDRDDIFGIRTPADLHISTSEIWVSLSTGSGLTMNDFTEPDARTRYTGFYMATGFNRALVGDFNGDDFSDVVVWNALANNSDDGGLNKFWVGLSNGSTFQWGATDPRGGHLAWGYANVSNMVYTVVGNFNGNRSPVLNYPIDDLAWFSSISYVGGRDYFSFLSNGTNAFNTAVTTPPTPGTPLLLGRVRMEPFVGTMVGGQVNPGNHVMVGDLEGDGDDDIVSHETNGTVFRLWSNWLPALPNGIIPFAFTRDFNFWINSSDYPNTLRVFHIIGGYLK